VQIDCQADLSAPWRTGGGNSRPAAAPLVAVVLPPREGFGPGRTGAIGLIAQRLAAAPGFRSVVIGGAQAGPTFAGIYFCPARPPIWLPGNINVRYAAGVAGLLRRLRPALTEVHNRPEVALALARRMPGARISLFLHNDPRSMRSAGTPDERHALLARLAGVVTVSDYLRRRLLEGIAAPPALPVVLPNCIELSALPAALGQREPVILFVGRVVPEKAPDAFVAACAIALPQLPGWRGEIIGADRSRADSPDTRFVRCVREAARAAGVTLFGYRDHPDVLAALARASIVVVPSRWQEPFGLIALEAMASGAALICAPRGGLPEVAGDAALYADPEDPAALADAILALAGDPARRDGLAAAGRMRARRFDLPPTLALLASLRRAILAAGDNGRRS
jgi:UDP-glucose:(glucosyl)LPS alpha-1,2-glucosyltransferase